MFISKNIGGVIMKRRLLKNAFIRFPIVCLILLLLFFCLASCAEKKNDNFFGTLEYPEELYVWAYSSIEPLAPFSYGDKEVIKNIIDMINNCDFEVASIDWNDLTNPRFSIPIGEDDYDMKGDGNGNYYFTLSSSDIAEDTGENATEYCDVIYRANGFDYDIFMTLFEKPGDTE